MINRQVLHYSGKMLYTDDFCHIFTAHRNIFFAKRMFEQYNKQEEKKKKEAEGEEKLAKIEAKAFVGDEKLLQKEIEKLFSEPSFKKKQILEKSIQKKIELLRKAKVLEVVSLNIINSIEKDKIKDFAKDVLENSTQEIAKKNDKKVDSLRSSIHSGGLFLPNEVDVIAEVGLENIISRLDEDVDLALFLKLFAKIENSEDLYKSLHEDLTDILANDDISDKNKSIIFDKFVDLYIVEERISGKKREDIQAEIIRDKEIEEFDYVKKLLKEMKKNKESIQELVLKPLDEDSDDLRARNIGLQKKEAEMLAKVRNFLGAEVANGAEERMNEHAKTDFEQRSIAYFSYINEEIKPSIEAIKKREIDIAKKYAEKQQKVLQFSLSLMIGYSPKERDIKKKRIEEEFGIFYEYLEALSLSKVQNSYLPVLHFLTQGGRTASQREAIKNLNILTEEDISIVEGIESKRKIFEDLVVGQRLQYSEDTSIMTTILESSEYKELKKEDPKCVGKLFDFVKSKNILTDKGIVAICGEENLEYRPEYFIAANTFLGDWIGGEHNKYILNNLVSGVGDIIIPKDVLLRYGREFSKTGKVSDNVLRFFTKNRIESGIRDVVNSVYRVGEDVVAYAKETGKFTEDGITGKLKETYTFFENTAKLVDRKIKAIRNVGIVLHEIINKYDGDVKNLYFIEIQKILKELENNYKSVKKDVENYSLHSGKSETEKFISLKLHDFIDVKNAQEKEKRLEFVNAEIKKLSVQYSEESVNDLIESITSEFEKDMRDKTGGKNLYVFLTGISPDIFTSEESLLPEKILFQFIAEKNGVTAESISVLQDLMKVKNKFGEFCIIDGDKTAYYPKKNQIVLEKHIFEELQNFDHSKDLHKLKYSDESRSFQENLGDIFHEVGHSMIAKNGLMILRFTHLLKESFGKEYSIFLERVNKVYGDEILENNIEELLAEVCSLLQFDDNAKNNFIEKDSLLETVFSHVDESKLQKIFNLSLYKEQERGEVVKNLSTDGRNADERTAEEYFKEESEKQKKEKELEELKRNNPDFYTSAKKQEKQEALNVLIYGNEKGEYRKEMDDTLLGYIEQLKDAKSYISGPAGANLGEAVKDLEKSMQEVIRYFNDPRKTSTENRADMVIEFTKDLRGQAEKYASELSRFDVAPGNVFSRAWKNTRFLSGDNVIDIAKQWWNYFLRRHARTNKERVGAVGAAMASGIAPGLATDFGKQQDVAKNAEIEEFQGAYKLLDDGDLINEFFNIGNEDSFKAYIAEMSSRGLMDWGRQDDDGNRVYARKLNSYGSHIRFYENDFLYKEGEETALNNKFQKAFLDVYGENDLFYNFYSDNKNAIDSKTNDAVSVAAVRGGNPQQMLEWLYKHEHGEFVNPNVYEGFIKLMIGDGTTDPANYLYYLIAGVYTGLLEVSAFPRFYGYYGNVFPPFNGLAGYSKSDAHNAMEAVMKNKDGSYRNAWDGPPEIWGGWVHANIMTLPSTVARTFINLGQKGAGKFDHDNAGLLASVGRADTAGQMLAQASTGNLETKSTLFNQAIYGQVQHILGLSNQDYNGDNNNFDFQILQKDIARQAGFFSATDALINSRLDSSKSKFKATDDFLKDKPRAGDGYSGSLKTEDYLKMGRAIYSNVYTKKFKDLADTFLFAGSYDHDADGFKKRWEDLRKDTYVKNYIFKGEFVPELKTSGNIDQQYAIIVNKIFNHFFLDHPDAKKNVLSVVNAAQDIYFGKGVSGVEESGKWGADASVVPYQFVENYKNKRGSLI